MAVQTPKQRIANEKFAKRNEQKLGKARKTTAKKGPALSKTWVYVLLFLLIGGGILELMTLFM
ncbi:LANO_0E09428g1_1 [Lachancea nothofagi CBS 11611]|uniref:Stress-associated endoplasmic reticulum protein n=1 Tax=Lachancea nothofagi CBS 11611 TaxID=1266666 RepID=A0A1G4JVS8_9SACH|nr:LANO_0E09428g1_1 [Lachancea nothofagi CBS 11611]